MFRHASGWVFGAVLILSATATAQELPVPLPPVPLPDTSRPSAQKPAPRPDPQTPQPAPKPEPATPRATPPPSTGIRPIVRGRDLNVQIEVTISDQIATSAPEKRVVAMIVADRAFGRIRSNASQGLAVLNIDARAELLENDRIVVELTVEYNPAPPEGAPLKRPAALNEMLTVILQNGKPLLVSQAADPLTDRRMTVEVRASVVK
jgi:hypothetical protein